MTSKVQTPVVRRSPTSAPHLQFGIPLGRSTLRALEKRGIFCQTSISLEHQHLAKRYVLRGVESGGAVADMGRYCAYLNAEGQPIPWLQSIDSLSGNGRHAVVVAPELVRVEMFRVGHTYELAITRHTLVTDDGRVKPRIASSLLFRGREGSLALDLWSKENHGLRGAIVPNFYSGSGEQRQIPIQFEDSVKSATVALNCLACKHVHIAVARVA